MYLPLITLAPPAGSSEVTPRNHFFRKCYSGSITNDNIWHHTTFRAGTSILKVYIQQIQK